MMGSLHSRLQDLSCGDVLSNCPLARYTSFAIGGPADALIVVHKQEKLAFLLAFLRSESLSWRVLGKGSNLLVSDDGYRGVAIILGKEFSQIEEIQKSEKKSISLRVGAGCSLTKLNNYCCRQGFGGMVFSYGIPGTLGGAVLMNAGAWGSEMAEVVSEVGVVTAAGYEKITGEKLDFTYRRWPGFASYLGRGVISDVTLTLSSDDPLVLQERAKQQLIQRKSKQPHNFPNGGSIFKNPPGTSAGQLIDECGFKGEAVGGAMVSRKHANFIINRKKATAEDVQTLMATIQDGVKKRFGVELEPEIHVL